MAGTATTNASGGCGSGLGSDSGVGPAVLSLPPPRPKSPPDLYGRRRDLARLKMLEREKGLLEEELRFVEGLQPASRCCKEVVEFVTAKGDPLIPTNKKISKTCRLWKWLCGSSCFNLSWICCCTGCPNLKIRAPKCICCCDMPDCSCGMPDCCSCISCSLPKCSCWCKPSCISCCPKNPCPKNCCSLKSCCNFNLRKSCCNFNLRQCLPCYNCCSCKCSCPKCTCPKCSCPECSCPSCSCPDCSCPSCSCPDCSCPNCICPKCSDVCGCNCGCGCGCGCARGCLNCIKYYCCCCPSSCICC